jgi:hypothetical protein
MSAVAEAVQTSVPEPDLFGKSPAAPGVRCELQLIGTVAHHAEVRSKPLDGQHYVPVVCVDLENVGAGHNTVHAEQPFTEATRHEAEALAKQLRKGTTVTATTSLSDIRLYLPAAVLSIHHPN